MPSGTSGSGSPPASTEPRSRPGFARPSTTTKASMASRSTSDPLADHLLAPEDTESREVARRLDSLVRSHLGTRAGRTLGSGRCRSRGPSPVARRQIIGAAARGNSRLVRCVRVGRRAPQFGTLRTPADACFRGVPGSGPCGCKSVEVRVLSSALRKGLRTGSFCSVTRRLRCGTRRSVATVWQQRLCRPRGAHSLRCVVCSTCP